MHYFSQRTRLLPLLAGVSFLLLLNVYLFLMQQNAMRQQAESLLQVAGLHNNGTNTSPVWITAENGLVSQTPPAATAYFAINSSANTVVYIDKRLLLAPTLWFYLLLNGGIVMLAELLSLYWRKRRMALVLELDDAASELAALEDKVEITVPTAATMATRLQQVTQRIDFMLKRDQEVRHLVRVQGLIDHELAIGNRVFFESKLQHYLADVSESEYGALYIIQLSHPETGYARVKQLNRLRGCVDILQAMATGYSDAVLARLSDNDLVLLVAGIVSKDMAKLGDRMATLLSRASCFADCVDREVLHIGYASYQRGQTSYQVLSEADMALRTAQLHGPNAAFGFVQDSRPQAKGSVWWRSELTKALQEQRFALSFQPVFSWQEGDILQHEVLIRLQSSDGGTIPAAIFLPMAYNCGLASQIDRYVIRKTARLCAADSRTFSRCSVNISIQSLLEPQWWEWLDQMLLSAQLEPQQLAFEICEHHLLKHYSQLKNSLIKLHKSGFTLIVDQVGLVIDTALYVDELPLESVKLHPSVVRNIDKHLEQQLFVRGLIAGYAVKGIRVIATGVELEQEWLALQKLGVAGGQGLYFSQTLNQIITQSQLQ
jgi:RNase E specificity factor CsrD